MEKTTLGQFVRDQEDEKVALLLQSQIARAQRATNGRDFNNVQIGGIDEMGEAAGTCDMCTEQISVREDIVSTEEGVRDDLARVLVHEAAHAEGIRFDGIAELEVQLRMGEPPVPAYQRKFDHARHLGDEIGDERLVELSKAPDADVLIIQEFVSSRLKNMAANDNAAEVEQVATDEAQNYLDMAA